MEKWMEPKPETPDNTPQGPPRSEDEANAEAIELRDGFKRILEQEMSSLIQSLDQLIEMHDTHKQQTMQKTYLHRARRALIDGKDWFDWERKEKSRRAPASGGTVNGN